MQNIELMPMPNVEGCTLEPDGLSDHPQPAVILVMDSKLEGSSLQKLTSLLCMNGVSSFAKKAHDLIFLCLYLTRKQSEDLAQKYSYNVRFMIKKGRNHANCDSLWTKFISLIQYGSTAYKSFTEVNYSIAYCKNLESSLNEEDIEVLNSVRVQSELIYLILKSEFILNEEKFMIKADFVPHSRDLIKLRDKISWMPLSFPLEEFRDYFGEEMSFGYAWSNFWVLFGLFPISIAACMSLIYGLCTFKSHIPDFYSLRTQFDSEFWDEFADVMLNPASDIYIGFVLVVISVFQYQWSKAESIMSLQWGVSNYSVQEEECKQTYTHQKIRKYIRIPAILISLIGFLFAAGSTLLLFILTEIILRVNLNRIQLEFLSDDKRIWTISLVCSLFYTTLNTLAGAYFIPWISEILTSFENHKFQSYYNNSIILKSTGYYLVTSYFYLIYLIFGLNVWLSNTFNLEKGTLSECGDGICFITITQQIVSQILILRLKSVGKVLFSWIAAKVKGYFRKAHYQVTKSQDLLYIINSYKNIDFIGTDGYMLWMTERVIMYGYIVIFSYHLPIVSVLALVLEVMVTNFELRWLSCSQRPRPKRCSNINQWTSIFYLINIMGAIINSYAIALRITDYQTGNTGTPQFTNVSLIVLPVFIIVMSLIHIQGAASGDKVQSHLHAQYRAGLSLIIGARHRASSQDGGKSEHSDVGNEATTLI